MDTWTLQDAKARLSELVNRALTDGPQIITRHGNKTVVVVPYGDFAQTAPAMDFKTFLLSSRGVSDLPLTREDDTGREDAFEIPS